MYFFFNFANGGVRGETGISFKILSSCRGKQEEDHQIWLDNSFANSCHEFGRTKLSPHSQSSGSRTRYQSFRSSYLLSFELVMLTKRSSAVAAGNMRTDMGFNPENDFAKYCM